jgi:hypothetical protein
MLGKPICAAVSYPLSVQLTDAGQRVQTPASPQHRVVVRQRREGEELGDGDAAVGRRIA